MGQEPTGREPNESTSKEITNSAGVEIYPNSLKTQRPMMHILSTKPLKSRTLKKYKEKRKSLYS